MEQGHFDHSTKQFLLLWDIPWPVVAAVSEESFCSLPGPHCSWWNLHYAESAKDILKFSTPIIVQSLHTKRSANLVLADFDSGAGCSHYLSRGLHFVADNVAQESSYFSSPASLRKSVCTLKITVVIFLILSMLSTTSSAPRFLCSVTVLGSLDGCWLFFVNSW